MNRIISIFFVVFFWFTVVLQFTLVPILIFYKWILFLRKTKKDIIFFENFPVNNSGYYYRAQAWCDMLDKLRYKTRVRTLFKKKKQWDKLMKVNFRLFLMLSMWIRFFQLFSVFNYKTVVVRRELLLFNEYGNLYLDRLLNRIHPNVILDIDDDLGASKNEPRVIKSIFGKILLETGLKFHESILLYKRFIVGTEYLLNLVKSKNAFADVTVIPTCVHSTNHKHEFNLNKRVFGWIGSIENLKTLWSLVPIFNELQKRYSFKVVTISGIPLGYNGRIDFELEHIQWDRAKDIQNIDHIDVGLMPLENNAFTRGKCGFKLIQYMSLGIPSIGQNITINNQIISSENQGWIVSNIAEWEAAIIESLELDVNLLSTKGSFSQKQINEKFSFEANLAKLIDFIQIV